MSLDIITVTLNGKEFDGWTGGDSLVFPDSDKMSTSSTDEKVEEVTIKLLPNSPLVNFIKSQILAIENGSPNKLEGSVVFSDGITARIRLKSINFSSFNSTVTVTLLTDSLTETNLTELYSKFI